MKSFCKAALAALIFAVPAQAQAGEWWLVTGEPGDDAAQFADSASIVETGNMRTITIADHRRDGRNSERTVSIRCDRAGTTALDRFTCGDDAYRMRTAMLLGETSRESFARILFSVPKAGADVKVASN